MRLKDLTTTDEFRRVVELEKLVWGYTDAEDVVPVPIFTITVKRGAVLIGAFNERDEMVGFVYSIAGLKDRRPMQWSHMLGVLDEYRNTGLGHRLKLEQRARTLSMGLGLIEWTFDPMQALNAHLNFRKLGVIVREYEENIYGESSSPLHRGNPTDRFVAEWWLKSHRVECRLRGDADADLGGRAAAINVTRPWKDWRICDERDLTRREPLVAVEIPTGFSEMLVQDPALALEWRMAAREILTTYLEDGYAVVDFVLEREHGRGRYILANRTAAAEILKEVE